MWVGRAYPLRHPHSWIGCWFQKWYQDQDPADVGFDLPYPQEAVEKSTSSSISSFNYCLLYVHILRPDMITWLLRSADVITDGQTHLCLGWSAAHRCLFYLENPWIGLHWVSDHAHFWGWHLSCETYNSVDTVASIEDNFVEPASVTIQTEKWVSLRSH